MANRRFDGTQPFPGQAKTGPSRHHRISRLSFSCSLDVQRQACKVKLLAEGCEPAITVRDAAHLRHTGQEGGTLNVTRS